MQLELSDVKRGTPKNPTKWSNQQQKLLELDPFTTFIGGMEEKKMDWKTQAVTQKFHFRGTNLNVTASAYHSNYMQYLEKCWADHLSIVISPDIIWHTLLNEVASIVKENPNHYRHLFSTKEEKQEITVISGSLTEMPLGVLVDALKAYVPTDTSKFIPSFTTTNERSLHAFYSAFCDICSPYYDYSMKMCGFPAISVLGTEEDWGMLALHWEDLGKLFPSEEAYFKRTQNILNGITKYFTNQEMWKKIFTVEKCGSGSEQLIFGWYSGLFRNRPSLAKSENFPTNVSQVEYTQLDTGRKFTMKDGIFSSTLKDDFMVPEFASIILERK